ncbi:MAG TPA: cytochrome c oxidase subunit 3 [Actinomycetota bacterium]|jgi:cytochrome c oxidase subunit 3/cytochrome o ubiquinol oxidase subunit 3
MAAEPHTAEHLPTATGLDNRKLAMWTFLGSECLFFGALISTFLLYRKNVPEGEIIPSEIYDIPYTSVSSFVLLMSSLTMVLALAAIQRGDHRQLRIWLVCTAALGMVFISGQVFEFTEFIEHGFTIRSSVAGSAFFLLTGFHGAHVTVGILMLLTLAMLSSTGRLTQEHTLRVEMIGLYWHFVDIVWIVIFTLVYLIP